MKKLIFTILSLSVLFTSSANADGFCQNWEHGDIVIGGQQPNGSIAPKPFCWQVSDLQGLFEYYGSYYETGDDEDSGEMLEVQGYNNSIANFYGWYKDYAYGEMYYGIYVFAEVYGFPQDTPKVTLNNLPGVLKGTDNILSLSGNILNGTRYKFFIPVETVTSAQTLGDLDIYGTVRIFDGLDLKREFIIF